MTTDDLKTLIGQVTDHVAALSLLGQTIDTETMTHEQMDVTAAYQQDEAALQRWRAASRTIWNAYEELRQCARALAEASWADPTVNPLDAANAEIAELKARLAVVVSQPSS